MIWFHNNKNNGKLIRDMVLNPQKNDENDILDTVDSLDDSLNMQLYIGVIFKENHYNGRFLKLKMLLTF